MRLRHSAWRLVLALFAAAPASPASVRAQFGAPYAIAPAPARYAAAIERARTLVRDSVARSSPGIPGVSVAVAVDGDVVWSEGFGYADVEERAPVWPSTRFRVASVSKALTAAAVGLLVEQGKLDLDAPVQRYVPSFPKKKQPITTRQLAGHLAGIRHYQGDEFASMRHYDSVREGLSIFQNDTLLAPPGAKFSYSTYGWSVIAAVIESASGESYLRYMHDHVFEPLGMRATVAEFADSIIEGRAHFYRHADDRRLVNAPYVDNSYKWAGGGFLSTSEDLVRYGSALLRPGFLREETLKLLFTSQRTTAGAETGVGIAWFVGTDADGHRTYSHSGGAMGGNAFLLIYPDQRIVVAMLTNTETGFVGGGRGARQIGEIFLGAQR
jgi:CubicO group peptidase (beta-lactamase class C family)